jgi:hypothetical protein
MGDSGEGLIDNEARIQERMEELQRSRDQARKPAIKNPRLLQHIESLQLARKEMARSLENTTHDARRKQLAPALAEIELRIKDLQSQQ